MSVAQPIRGSLKVKLTNTLGATERGYSLNVYVSDGGTLDSSAVLLSSIRKASAVRAGKSTTVLVPIRKLPLSLANGAYFLFAQTVDAAGNNPSAVTASTFALADPFVSLSASVSAVKPVLIPQKKTGSLIVTLTNNGNVNATGSLVLTLSPSSDGVSAIAGITLTTLTRRVTLKPGRSGKYTIRFKIPTALAAGLYSPYVAVSLNDVSATAVGAVSFTVG
jgi:hypothetical protein